MHLITGMMQIVMPRGIFMYHNKSNIYIYIYLKKINKKYLIEFKLKSSYSLMFQVKKIFHLKYNLKIATQIG